MKAFLVAIALLGLSIYAQAHADEAVKNHPCKTIKAACESAGFVKGDHKKDGKGLYRDCMKPILKGETVAGVTVSADEVQACQAAKAKHKAKRDAAKS